MHRQSCIRMATLSAHKSRHTLHMLICKLHRSFHFTVAPLPFNFISVECSVPAFNISCARRAATGCVWAQWHNSMLIPSVCLILCPALCNHHSLRSFYWLPQPVALAATSVILPPVALAGSQDMLRDSKLSSRLSFFLPRALLP